MKFRSLLVNDFTIKTTDTNNKHRTHCFDSICLIGYPLQFVVSQSELSVEKTP